MAGCTKGCKEEFRCSNFGLTHPHPEYFVTSQWSATCGCMNIFYLLFRLAVAIGFIVMQIFEILNFLEPNPSLPWYRYLYNWSSALLTLDVILQFVLAAYGYSLYRKIGIWDKVFPYMPWYLKLQWLITNVATCAGFLVVGLFWTIIARTLEFDVPITFLFFHGINAAYLFLNLLITAMPVRIYHVFYSWLYLALYIGFDAIFQLILAKEPAYGTLLDWKNEITLLTILSVTVFPFLVPLVVWLTYYSNYRIRLMISGCCAKDEPEGHKPAIFESPERGVDNQGFQEQSNGFSGQPLSQTNFDQRATIDDPFTRNQPLPINYGNKDGMFQTMANPSVQDPHKMNIMTNNMRNVNTANPPHNQPLPINYGNKDGMFQTMANPSMADPDKVNIMTNNMRNVNTANPLRNQPLPINYGNKVGMFQTMADTNNGITMNTDNTPQNTSPSYDPRQPMTYNNRYPGDKTRQDGMTAVDNNGFISKLYVN